MRVLGDTGTVTQALITGNVDAMVVPYSYADMAKRAGASSLADVGTVNVVFQPPSCARQKIPPRYHDTMVGITKGIVESLVYILDPANKRDVGEALKKNLRLSKDEDIEAAYKVSRLQMPNLDIAPNLEAWRLLNGWSSGSTRKFRKRTWSSDRHRPAQIWKPAASWRRCERIAAMTKLCSHEGTNMTKVTKENMNLFSEFVYFALRGKAGNHVNF